MKNLRIKYIHIILITGLFALATAGCKNEPDYKAVRQQVMDLHDKVMGDGEKAVKNRMLLDSLSKSGLRQAKASHPDMDTLSARIQINHLIVRLNEADDAMMDWMHHFQPDTEGKTNAEAVKYFQDEMLKIKSLDHRYQQVLKESDTYLQQFNLSSGSTGSKHDHQH